MRPEEDVVPETARQIADNIVEGRPMVSTVKARSKLNDLIQLREPSSSSYMLANETYSDLSNGVDRWMQPTRNPGGNRPVVVRDRPPMVQRSVSARRSMMDSTGLWYMLALLLPIFGLGDSQQWRCTPNLFINGSQLMMAHLRQACSHARTQLRNLAHDRIARELFATAMDIVLVIYAIGFLILSMYQASIFG